MNEVIYDMKVDIASMSILVKFKKGTVYRMRLDFNFFVDLSFYYPSFSQESIEDGIMLDKFMFDKIYLRIVFIFDNYFIFYDYNQYMDSFIPYQMYQNQQFSKIAKSNNPEILMNVLIDLNNKVWIIDRGEETIRQIYQHQEQIQHTILIYSFNEITYIGIFSYQKSYILIIDSIKNDSQVYLILDKIQVQTFLLKNKNDKSRYDLAIIDNLNILTIIDIITKDVIELQLECSSYFSYIYREEKGYLIISCIEAKIFILDVQQKILNLIDLQQTDAIISLEEFNNFVFIGLNNGKLFAFEVIKPQNSGFKFKNYHLIKMKNEDISKFNILIYWDFDLMRVLIRSKYNKIFNSFKFEIIFDSENNLQSISANYLINMLVSRETIEEIFFRDGLMFVIYQNNIEYYNATTYQFYDRTSVEMNYMIISKYLYISKYILIISQQNKIQVYQICEKNKKIFLFIQYDSTTIRLLSVDKWNSLDNNKKNQISIMFDQQDSIQIEFISPYNQQILQKITQNQNPQFLSMINNCQANFKINNILDFQQEATQIQNVKQTPNILLNLSEQTFFHDILFKLNDKMVTLYTDAYRIVKLDKYFLNVITAQHMNICNLTLLLFNDFQAMFNKQVQKISFLNLFIIGSSLEGRQKVFDNQINYLIRNSTIKWDQIQYINQQNVTFSNILFEQMDYFTTASNINQFYIENLVFEYCYFKDIKYIFQIQNISNFQINSITFKYCQFKNIKNIFSIQQCNDVKFKSFQFISNFNEDTFYQTIAINSTGNEKFEIHSSLFQNNTNFQLINTSRLFIQVVNNEIEIVSLKQDLFKLEDTKFHQNLCNIQMDALVALSNSEIKLSNLNISYNICQYCSGTINIPQSRILQIYDSHFISNSAFDGGAILSQQVENFILKNNNFYENNAMRYGGAIYLFLAEINLENTFFINNTATIGGAIRQIDVYKSELKYQNFDYFQNNKAILYGNDIGFSPIQLKIEINIQESDFDLDTNKTLKLSDENIYFQQIKSGSKIDLIINFYDQDKRKIQFNYNKLDDQQQKIISDELNKYSINIQIPQESKDLIQLQGMKIINLYEAFDKETNTFQLKNILLVGELQSCGTINVFSNFLDKEVLLYFEKDVSLELKFCFRLCKSGEIPNIYQNNLYICFECEEGTFSFFEMTNKTLLYNENEEIKCKKCPLGVKSCSKNQMYLQNESQFQ